MNETELTIAATSAETAAFELVQRQAKMLASSTLVPKEFQNNMANCAIGLNIAKRLGADPFMVLQNIDVIHGRPSFRATFLIAMVNASGRFSPLKFKLEGEGADRTCYAYATDKASGETVEGPAVSMAMAKAEGWSTKAGSKWVSMPEVMLRYRSAAFFARLYAPDITLGMQTAEEVEDITPPERNITPAKVPAVAGLFAPVETSQSVMPTILLRIKLEEANISLVDATEYLRSQAVTEALSFDDITDDEARAALTGFGYLVSALSQYTEPKSTPAE
jgi:hypothetical protein